MKEEPYFGFCDVENCHNEASSGGICWRETGYWNICSFHFWQFKEGNVQPEMKKTAIERESRRIDGFLKC